MMDSRIQRQLAAHIREEKRKNGEKIDWQKAMKIAFDRLLQRAC